MLKSNFILVSLTITKPKMTEKDKRVTKDVARNENASEAAVSVVKRLYPKHLIEPLTEIESAARRYVESVTQSWGRGLNALPLALFMVDGGFKDSIGVFKLQFEQAVTVFMQNFVNVMSRAQEEQGDMFDQTVYPDVAELRSEFSFGVKYIPISDVPSVMLGVDEQHEAEARKTMMESTRKSLADGQRDLYDRLGKAVKRISVQCNNEKGKIFDSLTGNLEELLKVLPHLNLAGDQQFADLCAEAARLVVAPETIKTVPEVRQQMAATADDILAKMAAFV